MVEIQVKLDVRSNVASPTVENDCLPVRYGLMRLFGVSGNRSFDRLC